MPLDFPALPWLEMIARLVLAAAAGAAVGLERERHDSPAGFRTHVLVSAGACLFTLVSIATAGDRWDPGRIAAGIITGIGFIGAGTIIRHGASVRGLTTAASLWAVSAVGMAAGIGWWQAAVFGTLLLWLSLQGLKWVENNLLHSKTVVGLQVEVDAAKLSLPALRTALTAKGHEPANVELAYFNGSDVACLTVHLEGVSDEAAAELADHLARLEGVRRVRTG